MSRPAIPKTIKDIVWARERGICEACREPVKERRHGQLDHRPALWSRERVPGLKDTDPAAYVPHANDPAFIHLLHSKPETGKNCHDLRTFGNGVYRGDVTESARTKKLLKKQAEFRSKVLSAESDKEQPNRQKPKTKWASRPMAGSKKSGLRKRMSGKVENR